MLKKNDCVAFVAYAKQVCELSNSQIQEVVQDVEREFFRYRIEEYTPILAFRSTVLISGELVAAPICRWFFVGLVNWYLRNSIPIPEKVARYIQPCLIPMVISKLRKLQKYSFVVSDQRIDEATCFTLEMMFNSVEGTQFLVPENFEYDFKTGTILINGNVRATCSVSTLTVLESAKLTGMWITVIKQANEKLPRVLAYASQNIVRASASIACRRFVENAIGKSITGKDTAFEVDDIEEKLKNLVSHHQPKPAEFPLGDFLHDENISIFFRSVIYAESLNCPFNEKPAAASAYCGRNLPSKTYYRLLKKARRVAARFYKNTVAKE